MRKISVTWTVTEEHGAVIEVPDDFDPEDVIWSEWLATYEGPETYSATPDREVDDWTFTTADTRNAAQTPSTPRVVPTEADPACPRCGKPANEVDDHVVDGEPTHEACLD